MMTINEFMDFRLQQRIAEEIYRQQIMQRIPDPFAAMMPFPMPIQLVMTSTQPPLTGVKAKLENDDLWQKFHQIGTEMIITKCGRRMFPSTRISLSGLEEEANYCVLLEMVPIGDCRYKFSGSQWVPAGGAEPQSPQRMYLHPDSPASGSHWQAQPILFNKVKLTNNTLDNSGQIVLASMHKYQPRIHVIRTSDLTQIPWAPQQAFVFTETEFVAVTAYQNDRITKLKIDHNPFAKGFRETSQSRCKRKISSSPTLVEGQPIRSELSRDISSDDDRVSISGDEDAQQTKRRRNSATSSPPLEDKSIACVRDTAEFHYAAAMAANLTCAPTTFTRSHYEATHNTHLCLHPRVNYAAHTLANPYLEQPYSMPANDSQSTTSVSPGTDAFVDVTSLEDERDGSVVDGTSVTVINSKNSFSISAILGSRNVVTA